MFKKIAIILLLISILYLFFFKQPLTHFQKIDSYKKISAEAIECPGTLITFDVDDTLLWLPWPKFSLLFRLQVLWNFPEFINANRWEQIYSELWWQANFKMIEPAVVQLIDTLKSRGCLVLGLTSMESGSYGVIPSMPEWRYQTLAHFGIKFTKKFGNHIFKNFPVYSDSYPMLYKGILCANQQSKGKVLEAVLTQLDVHPKKIVSFDDETSALRSIQEVCSKLHIPVACYQYVGAENLEKWNDRQMIEHIGDAISNINSPLFH